MSKGKKEEKVILPERFKDSMRGLLGDEADDFFEAMLMDPVTSIRLNGRKPVSVFEHGEKVKWCQHGIILAERPVFTLDPLFHAGAYYVQEPSSMIYETLTEKIVETLQRDSSRVSLSVLDMCAAPGGKTTAMINALPDGSKVVANEYISKRLPSLKENISRWGYRNVTVSNQDSSAFKKLGSEFDIVAVDAPCSGEGMMRKEAVAVSQWSPELIEDCSSLQKEILTNASETVKEGGYLIYSTCTFNRKENEENAKFIKENLGLEPFDPGFPEEWGIPRGIDTDLPVYRFMPHKTRGEGLFLSVFRKPGIWVNETKDTKKEILRTRGFCGTVKEKEKIADIDEILACDYDRSSFPQAELSLPQALAYLRGESIILGREIEKGIVTVTYRGLPLGQVKNIGSRANNLYPKNRRILMR